MARNAMVATVAITVPSMITMNHAARFAACGEGWVIPMVLMKAFDMRRSSFMFFRWLFEGMVAGIGDWHAFLTMAESEGWDEHL
jgi:hypothetical protein